MESSEVITPRMANSRRKARESMPRGIVRLWGVAPLICGILVSLQVAETAAAGDWRPLFNGKNLDGWEFRSGGKAPPSFVVENGAIVGRTRIPQNDAAYLATTESFEDFELIFDVRINEGLNSGVQVRSTAEGTMRGPQVEIEAESRKTGFIYGQGMGTWLSEDLPEKNDTFLADDWHRIRVRVQGRNIQTWIDDQPTADFTSDRIASEGVIALQIHGYPRGKQREQGADKVLSVAWKNIQIREI